MTKIKKKYVHLWLQFISSRCFSSLIRCKQRICPVRVVQSPQACQSRDAALCLAIWWEGPTSRVVLTSKPVNRAANYIWNTDKKKMTINISNLHIYVQVLSEILMICYSLEHKVPETSGRGWTWSYSRAIPIAGTKCLQESCKRTMPTAERRLSYLPPEDACWKELSKNLSDYPIIFGRWTQQRRSMLQDPS